MSECWSNTEVLVKVYSGQWQPQWSLQESNQRETMHRGTVVGDKVMGSANSSNKYPSLSFPICIVCFLFSIPCICWVWRMKRRVWVSAQRSCGRPAVAAAVRTWCCDLENGRSSAEGEARQPRGTWGAWNDPSQRKGDMVKGSPSFSPF